MKKKLLCLILSVVMVITVLHSTVCAIIEPLDDPSQPDIVNYYGALIYAADANDDQFKSVYSLYDFDCDGILELIIDNNEPHATRVVRFFKYDGELDFLTSFQPGYGELCRNPNGDGFITFHAYRNREWLELHTLGAEGFESEMLTAPREVYEASEYKEPHEIISGAYRLETCSVNSDELLKSAFANISEDKEISVVLDGKKIEFDQPPIMAEGDRVIVPVRAIFEAFGATVEWNPETKYVMSKKGSTIIGIEIGEYYLTKNVVKSYFDVPAQIINDRTLVPVRAVSEALGAEVKWDGAEKTVYIDTAPKINAIIINADDELTGNDAALVRSVLLENKLAKVNEQNFHSAFEPSEERFESVLEAAILQAGEDDITYFFYSGHADKSGSIYLDNKSFILSPQQILNALRFIPGTVVVIMNSCYSGEFNEIEGLDTNKFKIITACEGSQFSGIKDLALLFSSEKVGKFTEAFLNGLGGLEGGNVIYDTITQRDGKVKADYDKDCQVTIAELFKYIDENMDKRIIHDGETYYQNPTCSDTNDNTVIYSY